jgi:hypothetical protein
VRAVQPHLGPVGVFCAFPGFAISLWVRSFRNAEWRQNGFVRVVDLPGAMVGGGGCRRGFFPVRVPGEVGGD